MGLLSKLKSWRDKRRRAKKRFPYRWLTYKRRVRDDVEAAHNTKAGKELFSDKYIAALTATAQQIEAWQIKLYVYQLGLAAFLTVSLLTPDASFSVFGASLKTAPGFKELVLAIWSLLAGPMFALEQTKQLRLTVVEKIAELNAPKDLIEFAKLGTPAAFNLGVYAPKQYNRWIFPTLFPSRVTFFAITALGLFWMLALFTYLNVLWFYLVLTILSAPTLGGWSYVIVFYALGTSLMILLWFIRAHVPMRYRDQERAKKLEDIKATDPVAYEAGLIELYS